MNLLYRYSKQYWKLFVAALLLAATNQIFSLLDPLIFRHVIDSYATKYHQYTQAQFIRGAGLLLLAAVGVAFVSRVAKNFQDYFVNVIVQRLGAKMYSDGIRHSLDLPYQVFEDQRSGETLGKLQKVRSDVERFITAAINVLFISLVGIVFVMIYAFRVHWAIAPAFLITVPLLGIISSVLSKRIKKMQKTIVAETTALAGSTTESLRNIELVKSLGLAHQEVGRLNGITEKILKLELKKVKYLRSLSFIQGTAVNALRTSILFLMLYLIFRQEITIGQFFSLMIYSFFIFTPLQELGNVINIYRETEVSLQNFQQILDTPRDPKPADPEPVDELMTLQFERVSFQHQSSSVPGVGRDRFQRGSGRHDRVCGAVRGREVNAGEASGGLVRSESGRDSLQRDSIESRGSGSAAGKDRICDAGHATVFGLDSREPAVRESEGDGRGMHGGFAASGRAQLAFTRGPRIGYADRRRWREGFGRREAAAFDCSRAVAASAIAGVR